LQHIQVIDRQALTLLVGPVRARLRSAARSALYLLCLNLLGIGFGPALVAFFTDRIFGRDCATLGIPLRQSSALSHP